MILQIENNILLHRLSKLFTDDRTLYEYPNNVKAFYFTTDGLKDIFGKNYDFKIAIDNPYKFCDFKPAYGEIFADYLKGYDFWGHCDIDLLWGNI